MPTNSTPTPATFAAQLQRVKLASKAAQSLSTRLAYQAVSGRPAVRTSR